MNLQFVNQFVTSSLAVPLCPCQKDSMETIYKDIHSPEINLKKIQDLIRSAPPDLKIISEEGKVIHSHKLLFGLANSNLAKILLEDDFIGEHVTVFIPVSSAVLVKIIEEGGNLSQIQRIFFNSISTNEEDYHEYRNLKPSISISITKIEKEEHAVSFYDLPADKYDEDQPVTIKIQKKSALSDNGKSEKCSKCEREVSNLEVHRIACEQVSNGPGQCKTKVICPLCTKEVNFDYFVSIHYYKCSNWTVPGSDIARAKYKYEEKLKVDCPTCGKKVNKNYIVKHQEICNGVMGDHRCPYCKRKQIENMEVHVIACKQLGGAENIHSRKGRAKISCPLCGEKFRPRVFVGMHYYKCSNWTVPGSEEKRRLYELSEQKRKEKEGGPIACHECGKVLANNLALTNHIRNVHNPDNIFHHCDKCDYKSSVKSTLKNHIMSKHSVPEFLTCHICGDKSKNKQLLRNHHRLKHEVQEMIKCEICGKEVRKRTYTGHKIKAHGEKKFACEFCSYRTTSGFNLKLHVSKSHMGLKELPKSKCEYCDLETTNLPYHMGIYHPDKI